MERYRYQKNGARRAPLLFLARFLTPGFAGGRPARRRIKRCCFPLKFYSVLLGIATNSLIDDDIHVKIRLCTCASVMEATNVQRLRKLFSQIRHAFG